MLSEPMRIRLVSTSSGSDWRSASAPGGLFRRVFAKLRASRHGPDGAVFVTPFG
jgi:hypothetical protein